MKKMIFACLVAAAICAVGCGSQRGQTAETKASEPENKQLAGGDRDDHGCIGSAGYQWSQVKNDCIRIFEVGTKLISVENPQATSVGYLVFSSDSSQAELFLPGSAGGKLLVRPDAGKSEWLTPQGNEIYRLSSENGRWVVEFQGKPIYRQS